MKKLLWVVAILLAATTAFAEPISSPGEVWKARHFVMLDDRELFQDAVDAFLAGSKSGGKRVEKEQ